MIDGYGRELFLDFVPPSARDRAGAVPLLSGALVAQHGAALGAPVLEVEDLSRPQLAGFLRAARHADAMVAIAVSAAVRTASPEAARIAAESALSAARETHFDRPLVLVSRAAPLPAGADVERLSEGLYRDLAAGFTSFSFTAASVSGDAQTLARVCEPLLENQLGIEIELAADEPFDAALTLAALDDVLSQHGLPLAAVRGASEHDELGGALLVVPAAAALTSPSSDAVATVPRRVVITDELRAGVARIREDDAERLEAHTFEVAEAIIERLAAGGTATRFLDALAKDRV